MDPVDVLAGAGILRAPEVIELARAARLDLAAACVLLQKESGGGRNVWGSDAVLDGGVYRKGGPVTRENYLAYRELARTGGIGRQGCGPTQLTYGPFQDRADKAGGCFEWRANVATGFAILADLIARYGEREGFRRYNGSGPAAEKYAADAIARLMRWRALLAGAADHPAPQEEDVPLTRQEIEAIADAVWRRPTQNVKGEVPPAEAILAAAEGRAWDAQDRGHDIYALVRDLVARAPAGPGGTVDLDALADRIVDRLATRLGPQ